MRKRETDAVKINKKADGSKSIVLAFGVLYALLILFGLLHSDSEYSISERRKLAQMPAFSWQALVDGSYIQDVEEYVVDQFPFRDEFRAIKSYFSLSIMQKQDTGNIYVKDGYLCKMEYPMDENSIYRATMILEDFYEKYLQDTEVSPYISIVPDKNYFLADNGVLAMDYEEFYAQVYEQTPHLTPISIADKLQLTDYYKTDTHWKQEEIIDVAAVLAEKMDMPFEGDFTVKKTDVPFYGVYYGQAGLNLPADEIAYCTSERLNECLVYDYENDKEIPLYNKQNLVGRDPYEMFLGGNISLVTIESPKALTNKELVVVGDSFSRSLLPLLAESYQKITLVDIRYMWSGQVGNYVEFTDQDVLFLYSTSVLNDSVTLKG